MALIVCKSDHRTFWGRKTHSRGHPKGLSYIEETGKKNKGELILTSGGCCRILEGEDKPFHAKVRYGVILSSGVHRNRGKVYIDESDPDFDYDNNYCYFEIKEHPGWFVLIGKRVVFIMDGEAEEKVIG